MRPFLLLIVCYIHTSIFYAQDNQIVDQSLIAFDKEYGVENSTLNTGRIFNTVFRTVDRTHFFFEQFDFMQANVRYKNQLYHNVKVKYDLLSDQLIKPYEVLGDVSQLILRPEFVNGFDIGERKFIQLKKHVALTPFYVNGFFEVAHESEKFSLFIKHQKLKSKRYVNQRIFYSFKKKAIYVLKWGGNYYVVNNPKIVRQLFPEQKKRIRMFYAKQKDGINVKEMVRLFNDLTI